MDEFGVSWMTDVLKDIQNKGIQLELKKAESHPCTSRKVIPGASETIEAESF